MFEIFVILYIPRLSVQAAALTRGHVLELWGHLLRGASAGQDVPMTLDLSLELHARTNVVPRSALHFRWMPMTCRHRLLNPKP